MDSGGRRGRPGAKPGGVWALAVLTLILAPSTRAEPMVGEGVGTYTCAEFAADALMRRSSLQIGKFVAFISRPVTDGLNFKHY